MPHGAPPIPRPSNRASSVGVVPEEVYGQVNTEGNSPAQTLF
jgi:hypothetical protein